MAIKLEIKEVIIVEIQILGHTLAKLRITTCKQGTSGCSAGISKLK